MKDLGVFDRLERYGIDDLWLDIMNIRKAYSYGETFDVQTHHYSDYTQPTFENVYLTANHRLLIYSRGDDVFCKVYSTKKCPEDTRYCHVFYDETLEDSFHPKED